MRKAKGWNQEATDVNGRRRFHGAFTGGFSAGYFNTVGTKEGWTPSAFVSSRHTTEETKQTVEDFMDEEDDPLLGKKLTTKEQFHASDKLPQQQHTTNRIIPGPLPTDFIVPSDKSIGKKLLKQMGWREGQGIGPKIIKKKMPEEHEKEDAIVPVEYISVAPKNTFTLAMIPKPKLNDYGVGFDPYKDAPEFRRHRLQMAGKMQEKEVKKLTFASVLDASQEDGRFTRDYGLGALEEKDDDLEVYGHDSMSAYDIEAGPERKKLISNRSSEVKDRKAIAMKFTVGWDNQPALSGFRIAKHQRNPFTQDIDRIVVPPDFKCVHVSCDLKSDTNNVITRLQQHQFSTKKHGKSSSMTAADRGKLLGESIDNQDDDVVGESSKSDKEKKEMEKRNNELNDLGSQFRVGMTAAITNRFTSSASTKEQDSPTIQKNLPPERTQISWRPTNLLCKRFRVRPPGGKNDDSGSESKNMNELFEKEIVSHIPLMPNSMKKIDAPTEGSDDDEITIPEPVERPPEDIFKAIFEPSDDSDEDIIPDYEEVEESSSEEETKTTEPMSSPKIDNSSSIVENGNSNLMEGKLAGSTDNLYRKDDSSDSDSSSERKRKKSKKHRKSSGKKRKHKSSSSKSSKKDRVKKAKKSRH